MNMCAVAWALKEAADEDVVPLEQKAADRANAIPVTADAVEAAPDVHEAVFAAVKGRKGHRAHKLPAA